MRRGLGGLALGVALLFGMLTAAAWWAASSPKALQWLVAEAVQRSNGTLSFAGVSGSLITGVQVRQLTYTAADMRVVAENVALEMSVGALLRGRLEVAGIETAAADVHTTSSGKPSQPPDSLVLPFPIEINRVRIGRLRFKEQTVSNLTFKYQGGSAGHALRELVADTAWGRLSGGIAVAATKPFALSGQLQLERTNQWSAHVLLAGDLLITDVTARATAHGAVADAKAQIASFGPRRLRALHAHGENINTAAFVPGFPESAIEIDIVGADIHDEGPTGKIAIRNATPGSITENRLPLLSLSANYAVQDTAAVALANITADLGAAGSASGNARLARDASRLDLVVDALNLRALHAPLRTTRLSGVIKAELADAGQKVQINVAERGISIALSGSRRGDAVTLSEFRARAGAGKVQGDGELSLAGSWPYAFQARIERFDPAAFGDYPSAAITGRLAVSGSLAPQWRANVALTLANSLFRGVPLAGGVAGEFTPQGVRNMKADLALGANRLHADGGYGRPGDALAFALDAPRLSQFDAGMTGAITAKGRVAGTARQRRMDVDIAGTEIAWRQNVRIATLRLHAAGTLARHEATMSARGRDFALDARVDGGWEAARGWSGMLTSFQNAGAYPMQLLAPMPVAYAHRGYSAGPGKLDVDGGHVTLTTLAWRDGRLDTRGEARNFPVAPLLAISGVAAPLTTLRIGGAWSLTASPLLNGKLTLLRESGDMVTPGETSIALGLERLGIEVKFANGALDATLEMLAQSLSGKVHATATSLAREAILKAEGRLDIASLDVLRPMLGTQAFLRGSAAVNVAVNGTLGAPQLSGSAAVANLGIEAPQYGVRLRDGTLRADLDDEKLTLREFSIHGDEGSLTATGSMAREADGETQLAWRAQHLRVLNRPDMRLKLDGSGTAILAGKKLVLRGALSADEGHFEFDTPQAPRLSDDIIVVGRPKAVHATMGDSFRTRILDIDMTLDAGKQLHIVGAGLDTDLRGKVNLKSNPQGVLEARGALASVNGIYFVFGQRLEIERGRLIFDGPVNNPALDIVAKRKGLSVEAGVEVTGTVRVPTVQLISDPPVSDSEKLAWLTLGHGLQDSTGADLALLQTAATALIGRGNSVPLTQRIANRVGLNELSLKGGGQAGSQVAALGKRLSDKLYLEYQQGLATASTVLRLSYVLTRTLSLRLEAGYTSGLGLYFARSYD